MLFRRLPSLPSAAKRLVSTTARRSFSLVTIGWVVAAQPASALQTHFVIDGKVVEVELSRVNASHGTGYRHGEHYRGRVTGETDSWLRVSRIDGRWQGLLSSGGQFYLLEPHAQRERNREARALSQESLPFACGVDDSLHTASPHSIEQALRTTVSGFDQLCSKAINDTCAVIELEMLFDHHFVQAYPSNYREQGASLLNIVEGFYQESFGIRFDTLSATYLDENLFAEKPTSSAFLTELATKKATNALSFVQNPQAILHVVRGEPFTDEGTAGVAWLEGLCSDQGYASGTSVLYRPTSGGTPSIPITALVTTHEIGHNLGAQHDNTPGVACSNGYLMDAIVNPWANEFSSCSQSAIKSHLGDLSKWSSCTDYPVSLGIRADDDNTLNIDAPATLSHRLLIDYSQGATPPGSSGITLSLDGARAAEVNVDGTACRVNTDGSQWHCSLTRAANATVTYELTPTWSTATITATANLGNNSDFYNVADSGGNYRYEVTTPGPTMPASLRASVTTSQVELGWKDASTDETGFEVQRRINGGVWQSIATLAADTVRYSDTIGANANYDYRVLALGRNISSVPSNVVSVNTLQAETAVSGNGGGGGGSLHWLSLVILGSALLWRHPSNIGWPSRLSDRSRPRAPITPDKSHLP